jgi:hypothetical protein
MRANETSGRQLSSRCWRMIFMASRGEGEVANSSRSPGACQDNRWRTLQHNFFSSTSRLPISIWRLSYAQTLLVFHGSSHYAVRFGDRCTAELLDYIQWTCAIKNMQQVSAGRSRLRLIFQWVRGSAARQVSQPPKVSVSFSQLTNSHP